MDNINNNTQVKNTTSTTNTSTQVSASANIVKKNNRFLSIGIGFVISVVLLFIAFSFIQNTFIKAEDVSPRDVIVSEVTQNAAKVTWTTGRETQGVIEYGLTPGSLNFFAPETQKGMSHSLDLTLLSANTTYYFQIRIGEKKFDNGGAPWTFSTKAQGAQKQTNTPVQTLPTAPPAVDTPMPINTCQETDCEKIKEKMGDGCTTFDYINCKNKDAVPSLKQAVKLTPTVTPDLTITPTTTLTPTPTP